jgi:hypothetical protein
MICYPKWKYHRTLAACIVADAIAEAALGEGWADTPAAFYCHCQPGESCPHCEPAAPAPEESERPPARKKKVNR